MSGGTGRPGGVTLVGVLVVLMGLAMLVNGGIGLIGGGQGEAGIVVSVVLLVVGLIYLLVARGIFRGSRGARIIVVVISSIALIGSVLELFTEAQGQALSILTAAVAALILVLVFTPRARAFFS